MRAGSVRQEAGSAWPALRALALPGVLALWGALASAQTVAQPAAQPAAQTTAQATAQTAAQTAAAQRRNTEMHFMRNIVKNA